MKKKNPVFVYPAAVRQRGGNKVGWLYYLSESDAKAASKVAVRQAKHKAALGYDFGYQSPGAISREGDQYVVVIP